MGKTKEAGTSRPLPNIEQVFSVFQELQIAMVRAARHMRSPKEYQALARAAQEQCKAELEKLGLAQHIDWTNREEE